MPSVAMLATRATRILPYPSPCFYSSGTSTALRFHVRQFPASHLPFSRFQASAVKHFSQGPHGGLFTGRSPGSSCSTQHIRTFFVKCLESGRLCSQKIKALLPQTNLGLGLATIFAGSAGNVIYAQYSNRVREHCLYSAFAMGSVPDVERKEEFVEREGAALGIQSILKPQRNYAHYNMIVGNHGTGKTTLVRHVGHQLDGILYVNISPNSVTDKSFAQEFAKSFNWTPPIRFWLYILLSYWGISAGEAADNRALLVKVFKEFHNQAKIFKKNNGRPPVLVLDNVNRLTQCNPELQDILQDIAKDAADDGVFVTVFVTSKGQAPIQMLGRSASSRLGEVIEIGDLKHDEAIDFLCNKKVISKSVSQDIYSLVGGRVGLLVRAVNKLNSGQNFAGVQTLLLSDAKNVLRKGGIEQGGKFGTAGIQIASHILKHGSISLDDFYQIFGNQSQGDLLLSKNIFTTIPCSEWVFFDTKPMEIMVRALIENSDQKITTSAFQETGF